MYQYKNNLWPCSTRTHVFALVWNTHFRIIEFSILVLRRLRSQDFDIQNLQTFGRNILKYLNKHVFNVPKMISENELFKISVIQIVFFYFNEFEVFYERIDFQTLNLDWINKLKSNMSQFLKTNIEVSKRSNALLRLKRFPLYVSWHAQATDPSVISLIKEVSKSIECFRTSNKCSKYSAICFNVQNALDVQTKIVGHPRNWFGRPKKLLRRPKHLPKAFAWHIKSTFGERKRFWRS